MRRFALRKTAAATAAAATATAAPTSNRSSISINSNKQQQPQQQQATATATGTATAAAAAASTTATLRTIRSRLSLRKRLSAPPQLLSTDLSSWYFLSTLMSTIPHLTRDELAQKIYESVDFVTAKLTFIEQRAMNDNMKPHEALKIYEHL